jgi:hypothetical protein
MRPIPVGEALLWVEDVELRFKMDQAGFGVWFRSVLPLEQ